MRIEQLEYVASVIESGSLRRASERLHVSQPAISEGIAKLERELGVELLERHRSGARASAAGRVLLPHMLDALTAIEQIRTAARDDLATRRQLRIGTVNAGTAALVLPATRAVQERHPATSVEIRNLQQNEIVFGLAEGTVDLGLINVLQGDDLPAELEQTELLTGEPVAVLPAGHPLADREAVTADDLRSAPFIGMREGYLMFRIATRLFGNDLPASWHTTDGAEMGKMMVAQGLGITVLPSYSVTSDPLQHAGLITARPIKNLGATITMVALHRRQRQTPPVVREILTDLARIAAAISSDPTDAVRPAPAAAHPEGNHDG
ncbi:MAG: LysR family transcriptional regulator [Marmoricola sp.]